MEDSFSKNKAGTEVAGVACLPVAGPENPYQQLMMAGLNKSAGLKAFNGIHDKFLGIVRTAISYRPEYLHFDWIASYYFRRSRWLTYLSVVTFCGQVLLARWLNIKLVWTLHNLLPHDIAQPGVHRFCQRFLAQRCEWVRVFSEETVARAARELSVPTDRLRVVPEGDYTSVYPSSASQQEARKQLGFSADDKVFLNLGLIKPYKGILELIHCFKEARIPDAHLLIAGRIMDQAYGEQIRQALTDRVILIDQFIAPSKLQYYFKAADAVVLPFGNIENSGSVIMAMGFAKPIVAPRQGVVRKRLEQQDEWLYDHLEEVPQTLRRLANIPATTLQEIGNRNFAALSQHSWQDFASLFL